MWSSTCNIGVFVYFTHANIFLNKIIATERVDNYHATIDVAVTCGQALAICACVYLSCTC